MNKDLHRYMRLGVIHFMAYPTALEGEAFLETLKRIACDPDFDAVEVTAVEDAATRRRAAKLLEESGLWVAYGAQPQLLNRKLNLNSLVEEERKAAVARIKHDIDLACDLPCKGFGVLSGPFDGNRVEEAMDALEASLDEVSGYLAEKSDMPFCLEVFDYDVDKKSLIGPAERARAIGERMARLRDNFGLMVDLSHLPLLRETSKESLLPVAPYIRHAHMGNAVTIPGKPGYGDLHPRFGFPHSANGAEELVQYLRTLLEIGYLREDDPRVLSFEIKPFGDEDSDAILAGAKRVLRQAWAMV